MAARLALEYIEIDVDYCANTYGTSPCTASIPTTGARKCFNCKVDCQDTEHIINAPVTLRFGKPTDYLPKDIACIPSLVSVDFDPATLSLGKDLGQRASLTATFEDHRHSDTGIGFDKYLSERDYNPWEQGTFFGRFRARNPFLFGRAVRYIHGFVGQSLAEMTTHHLIIDSFDGPGLDGQFKIVGKDILKLADGDKALAPAVSNGFLLADITDSTTSGSLSPSGIGNTEYPSSGYLNLGGSEIVSFTRSGDALTLTRAQLGTKASTHSAGDRAQVVLRYVGQDPADIISDLLQTYAGVPSGNIPLTDWQNETATFLNRLYTATIANPTSVNTLIAELIEQAALVVWWDDIAEKVGLQVLRGINTVSKVFTPDNVLEGSLATAEQPDQRLSQVQTYFGQINPLTSLTDTANYRSVAPAIDEGLEADYGSAAIKQIFSRWIPAGGRTTADRLNAILLGRFGTPPRKLNFNLLAGANSDVNLAGGYQLKAWNFQDPTGASASVPIQVTRLKPAADMVGIEAQEMLFNTPAEDLTTRTIIFDSAINNVNLRTVHDSLFPTPESGITVVCQVLTGVMIGSASTASPAFDVGTWPVGVSLQLVVGGRIQGAGGKGGNAGAGDGSGLPGGVALYTRQAIDLEVGSGAIFGGGGGGGSGRSTLPAGGGGAGNVPGLAGTGSAGPAQDGTTEAGGDGRNKGSNPHGGDGGDPGQPGAVGTDSSGATHDVGGAAGAAIDGDSFVTVTVGPGDIRGPQIN